ncbi:MAG: HesA/MoeB/ThiF family protein [Planctomycetota bacterium]|jgi:molybdopterin/thiamine biosynthesis adenylyltransferase
MLTESQQALLNQVFREKNVKELSLRQGSEIAKLTDIPLKAVEYFALQKGFSPLRYQRNIGSLGIAGQRKLLEKKAIIVGLGGLGGYVLEQLVRMGLGRIVVVDSDLFDEANLNRQLLAEEENLGKKKVAEAEKRVKRVNKAVEFTGCACSLDQLADQVWPTADLVFDCLDNISDRLVLAGRCSAANVPLVHGAIAGWYGQVGIVWPGTKTFEKIYARCRCGIEQDTGTPPFTAAIAASLMVAEGLKILIGESSSRQRKMLFFDLRENEWQAVTF